MLSSPKIGQNNLISSCLQIFEKTLVSSFEKAVTDTLAALFEMAEHAESNNQEVTLFEQYNQLKKSSEKLLNSLSAITKNMPDEITEQISLDEEIVKLSLVEDEVLEISLALTQLESVLDIRYSKYLFALEKRLKILFSSVKITKDNMPLGVPSICWILSQTLELSESDVKTKVLLIESLKKQLGVSLLETYQSIDKIFVNAGILPNIKIEQKPIRRKSKNPASPNAESGLDNQENPGEAGYNTNDFSQPSGSQQYSGNPNQGPPSVSGQFSGSQNQGASSGSGQYSGSQNLGAPSGSEQYSGSQNQNHSPGNGQYSDNQNQSPAHGLSNEFDRRESGNLVNSIFDLMNQGRSTDIQGENLSNIDNNMMDHALENLSKVTSVAAGTTEIDKLKEMILDDVRNETGIYYPGLNKTQQNSLDIMGMFYDQVKQDNSIDTNILSSLNAINIPLLRTAMRDKQFFDDGEHPARQYLEKIIYAAQKWHGTPVVNKLHKFSSNLASDYDGSNDSFDDANDDLESFLKLTETRAKKSEEKWVNSAKGKEKLDYSRMKVEEITEDISQDAVPDFVKNVIKYVVQDALTLSLLRHGEDSDEWKKNIGMSKSIAKMANPKEIKKLTPKQKIESLHHLDQTMDDLGFSENDRKSTLQNIKDCAEAATVDKLDNKIKLKNVASINKSKDNVTKAASAKIEDIRELSSDEKTQLTKIKLMPYGTLFDFIINQQRDKIRRRLSWFSPVSNKALFVSLLGNKPYEKTLSAIAIDLARNNIIIVKVENKKYFNQVLKTIFSKLKGMGGSNATH